ncbi:signal peptidase II [Acanthopleuribacter pedis]|uniref:Lipoprotein signal peptidase n=1 Tax=Acanthopleuribacter pedis TaxID=442870 RepID=A0A8J7QFK7_9BACT|nr:signal peptidase II [Acanthopleuribacter pedis]MBO1317545.1 signal peptidase II [Acanthopleuribacter pedis]
MDQARKTNLTLFAGLAVFSTLISQLSGYWVNQWLAVGQSHKVFSFLYMTHVRNFGGIFGFKQGSGWWFAAFASVVLLGLIIYIWRAKDMARLEYLCFAVIIGGGLSNILDRFFYGSVIDYFDVRGIPHWHYIFNTADVLIHVGIWPMLIYSFWPRGKEAAEKENTVEES